MRPSSVQADARRTPSKAGKAAAMEAKAAVDKSKDSCLSEIKRLEKARADRRTKMTENRAERALEEKRNIAKGNPGDVDFQRMISIWRDARDGTTQEHRSPGDVKICIAIRKRPITGKEVKRKDHDSVTCMNPLVTVHSCKLKVDGITKFLDNTNFQFDHTFDEDDNGDEVYHYTAKPLVPYVLRKGRATVFAYGQTGSGKTHTMVGIQRDATADLFELLAQEQELAQHLEVYVSFFEIYGGRCQDLLNNRHRLVVREDGKGEVVIAGLEELQATSAEELEELIEKGNRNRTTHATESNDTSSRSHAICQISLRDTRGGGKLHGRLSLIDLAGSERGADTKSHNRQRRMEGAEINKSLLALKECIRALDSEQGHVPYRASKLTLVLKDSFTRKSSRTVMIATVSPGASAADHTINTLRYADRVKETKVTQFEAMPQPPTPRDEKSMDLDALAAPPMAKPPPAYRKFSGGSAGAEAKGRAVPERRESGLRIAAANGAAAAAAAVAASQGSAADGARGKKPDGPLSKLRQGGGAGAKAVQRSDSGDEDSALHSSMDSEANSDINYLHESLRKWNSTSGSEEVVELHRTVQGLFDEEEALLSMHMNVIQENAELLTEEGRLLQQIQGDNVVDYDIDAYASRLSEILQRKGQLLSMLQERLNSFRGHLDEEEDVSKRVSEMPQY